MNQILPYQVALQYSGLKEIAGKQDNPVIIQMFDALGYNGRALKDETSWCSAFVCFCNKTAGFQHTGKLYAYSWENFEGVEKVEEPQLGDIVVFWRGDYDGEPIPGTNIPKRHVAYFMNYDHQDSKYIQVFGGNQSNKAQTSPYFASRVKGFYRPKLNSSL